MQYNVEACKQAVQNRLYNDHAALYYLLLSKWERGQLQIPASNPALSPHPRLSLSGVPQVISVFIAVGCFVARAVASDYNSSLEGATELKFVPFCSS